MSHTLTRRHLLGAAGLLGASLTLPHFALASEEVQPWNHRLSGRGALDAVIGGYDVVAYFLGTGPLQGSDAFTATYKGGTFFFASAENRDLFVEAPEAYAPQFGGYCAFAVSRGSTAPIDPVAWTIHEGKLYLNANLRAQELWRQDIPGNIALGEANWPGIAAGLGA